MKALTLILLIVAGPAVSGELSDKIMVPGLYTDAPEGELMRYVHDRHLPTVIEGAVQPDADTQDIVNPVSLVDRALILTKLPGEVSRLALTENVDGKARPISDFSASSLNPVLLFFLESVVRNMANQTAGSPHYIRNRLRVAMGMAGAGNGFCREVLLCSSKCNAQI